MRTQKSESRSQESEKGGMSIEFKDALAPSDKTEDLFVCGERIGRIDSKAKPGPYRYHAWIQINGGPIGLIQGFAETKVAAIEHALSEGRKEAQMQLRAIAELEAKLFPGREVAE